MASFWKENQWFTRPKKKLKGELWFGEPKCKLGSKVVHFHFLKNACYTNFVKMEDMLWIEDIVKSASTPPF